MFHLKHTTRFASISQMVQNGRGRFNPKAALAAASIAIAGYAQKQARNYVVTKTGNYVAKKVAPYVKDTWSRVLRRMSSGSKYFTRIRSNISSFRGKSAWTSNGAKWHSASGRLRHSRLSRRFRPRRRSYSRR